MRTTAPQSSLRALTASVAIALCVLAAPADADRLAATIDTGQTVSADVGASGEAVSLGFLVTAGAKRNLSLTVKSTKGSDLLLDVDLVAPGGDVVDVAAAGGKAKIKSNQVKLKLKDIDEGGLWRLVVRGAEDTTGAFTAQMRVKEGLSEKGQAVVTLGGAVDVPIEAGSGVELAVAAKRSKGSQLVPDVLLLDATGRVVDRSIGAAAINAKKGQTKLKKFQVPTFGAYTVRFVGTGGTGGGLSYAISTKATKYTGVRPVAVPGPASFVEPDLQGMLDGSASTGAALTYLWQQVAGPVIELDDPTSARPTFTAPTLETEVAFQLAVAAGGVPSPPRLVQVAIARPPIADPGTTLRVAPGESVVLDGSGSLDRRGAGLAYGWDIVAGSGDIAARNTATPTLVAPTEAGVVRVRLTVDDGRASDSAELLVIVGDTDVAAADAGRTQIVGRMATVHLSGLASLRASGVLDGGASWTQVSGTPVTLANTETFTPSFTAPRTISDLVFELTVDGNTATTHRAIVRVRPDERNSAPWTRAPGPQVAVGGAVTLNASTTTDPDGDARLVRWAQTGGDVAPLSAPEGAVVTASGLAAPDGLWEFSVQARDAFAYGAPDTVRVRGPAQTGTPLAVAGADRSVSATTTVQLSGLASVAAAGELTYAWTQVTGADWLDLTTVGTFDSASPQPQLRLPADISSLTPTRTIALDLVVTDDTGPSAPDRINLTFTTIPRNGVPATTASADATNPLAGAVVTLLSTAVDRDGDPVSFEWTQVQGAAIALTPSRFVATPRFTAPPSGTYAWDFRAGDGFDTSAPIRVTVTVDAKPIAVATVTPPDGSAGTQVTFDASGSSDPDMGELTYRWTQTFGTTATIDTTAESFTLSAPDGGIGFQLIVNDGRQDSDPVTALFTEDAPPTVAPTANKTTAAYGASVTLLANPSDETGTVTYTWRQVNPNGTDPVVTLSSAAAKNPSFTVPVPSSAPFGTSPRATFAVRATRNGKSSDEQQVSVTFFASYNDTSLASSNRVYGIISSNCTSCHSGSNSTCPVGSGSNARGYGMGSATAFSGNSIGVGSCGSGKNRVQSSNSGQSYLIDRINGTGGSMPPGGLLPLSQRLLIRDWVDQGANTTR